MKSADNLPEMVRRTCKFHSASEPGFNTPPPVSARAAQAAGGDERLDGAFRQTQGPESIEGLAEIPTLALVAFEMASPTNPLSAVSANSGAVTRSNVYPWLNRFAMVSFRFRSHIHQAASLIGGLVEVSAAVIVIHPARRCGNTSWGKGGNDDAQR